MDIEIKNAIKLLAGRITNSTPGDDALRLTQAALNLAHTAQVIAHTAQYQTLTADK